MLNGPMELPELGQRPYWSESGNSPTDEKIRRARGCKHDEQRDLISGLARHLFDNQVRDGVAEEDRNDPSNDEDWLNALGCWLGWDASDTDQVITDASKDAMVILQHEEDTDPDVS